MAEAGSATAPSRRPLRENTTRANDPAACVGTDRRQTIQCEGNAAPSVSWCLTFEFSAAADDVTGLALGTKAATTSATQVQLSIISMQADGSTLPPRLLRQVVSRPRHADTDCAARTSAQNGHLEAWVELCDLPVVQRTQYGHTAAG